MLENPTGTLFLIEFLSVRVKLVPNPMETLENGPKEKNVDKQTYWRIQSVLFDKISLYNWYQTQSRLLTKDSNEREYFKRERQTAPKIILFSNF